MNSKRLKMKLQSGDKLRVLFLNDLGFQYGAGIALLRQIQSFLLMGHAVSGICWMQGGEEEMVPVVPNDCAGEWLGLCQLPHAHVSQGCTEENIIRIIVEKVRLNDPDVIIVGNIHGAMWPLKILLALRELESVVVAYMHDCYFVSGRCAYPGACVCYETGCNEKCPTAEEYPAVAPAKIADSWALRRKIFCGSHGVPLATNSRWTADIAKRALSAPFSVETVYYGLDDALFSPIDRALARHLLELPEDAFLILGGAVNVTDPRKGGHIFKKVINDFSDRAVFIVFGQESLGMKGVRATGLLRDYRKMPLLYSAADLFVGTALEEAFGQTLCEAAACGVPIVAFRAGGIPEIARHDVNARLVNTVEVQGLLDEIQLFMDNISVREQYGKAGRDLVCREFTLLKQGERWMEYLLKLVALMQPAVAPSETKQPNVFLTWIRFAVPGMLMQQNVDAMEYAITNMPSGKPIMGIGSFCGLSTIVLSHLLEKYASDVPLFTSDKWEFEGAPLETPIGDSQITHDAYHAFVKDTFLRTMKTFSANRLPYTIESLSDEFFRRWFSGEKTVDVFHRPVTLGGEISFCYIDGNHTYEFAKRDFENTDRALVSGGFILFADSADGSEWGVNQLTREIASGHQYELVSKNPNYLFRKR